jgi:hypothetical protein
MKTKLSIGVLFLLIGNINAICQMNEAGVLYSQTVTRDDNFFATPFTVKRGTLLLTNDSLIFKSKKSKHSRFSFSIPYDQIKYIKHPYAFLIPNRIKIRTKNGETYRLFTYKKKHIIKITREHLENT